MKFLKIIGIIVIIIVIISFFAWGDYSWNQKIKNNLKDKGWTLVYEQNKFASLYRPWTWFKTPITGLWYIDTYEFTRISENIALCKVINIQNNYYETETYVSYDLFHVKKFATYFPSEEELKLVASKDLNFNALEWNEFNEDTPGKALIDFVVQGFDILPKPPLGDNSGNKKIKDSKLIEDYKGELFPHISYEGIEYIGEFYQNYVYTNVNDAHSLADNHYVASVFVTREDLGILVYDHNSHQFAVMDDYELDNEEPEFYDLTEDNIYAKMWNKAYTSDWEDKDIKNGSENRKWIYIDTNYQEKEIDRFYFDPIIEYNKMIDHSAIRFLIMNEKRYTFYFDPDNNKYAPVTSDFFWVPLEEIKYQVMKDGEVGFGIWNFIKGRIE